MLPPARFSCQKVFPPTNIAVGRTDTIKQDVDIGTVRLNYRFGGPVASRY